MAGSRIASQGVLENNFNTLLAWRRPHGCLCS